MILALLSPLPHPGLPCQPPEAAPPAFLHSMAIVFILSLQGIFIQAWTRGSVDFQGSAMQILKHCSTFNLSSRY